MYKQAHQIQSKMLYHNGVPFWAFIVNSVPVFFILFLDCAGTIWLITFNDVEDINIAKISPFLSRFSARRRPLIINIIQRQIVR